MMSLTPWELPGPRSPTHNARYVARNVQHVAVVSGYVGVFSIFAPDIGGSNPTINVFRLAK
jgi:hypothetical protein